MKVPDFYVDQNEVRRREKLSPSGRFKILIRSYTTKDGCWNYSRGTVYDLKGKEICDIKRNYSTFHHSFVKKDGQEWLITGRSYMSQTIINLDNGKIYEPPGDHHDSAAFCWVNGTLSPDETILVVEGCHWACPFEYRFFDFSDPSKGWPELTVYENDNPTFLHLDRDKSPTFNLDGSITCYQTSRFFLPLSKYEDDLTDDDLDYLDKEEEEKGFVDEKNWRIETDRMITLKRQGDKMVIVDKWISDVEKDRIERRKKAAEEREKWIAEFKSSDPLYLKYQELIKDPRLNPSSHEGCGITYKGWCPDFTEKETRWCRRIIDRSDHQPYTIDLEWAVKTGPIKLQIYKDGKSYRTEFFEHSAGDMDKAFEHAFGLISN